MRLYGRFRLARATTLTAYRNGDGSKGLGVTKPTRPAPSRLRQAITNFTEIPLKPYTPTINNENKDGAPRHDNDN